MRSAVYLLAQTYDALAARGIGADPGHYLRHVHFIPTDAAAEAKWLEDFADKHKKKRRTSDRYVLYASDPKHGYLIIDMLDDPGAHDLWKNRRTKLANYDNAATDFCTYGPKSTIHK